MKFKITAVLSSIVLFAVAFGTFDSSIHSATSQFECRFEEDDKPGPERCLLGDVNL